MKREQTYSAHVRFQDLTPKPSTLRGRELLLSLRDSHPYKAIPFLEESLSLNQIGQRNFSTQRGVRSEEVVIHDEESAVSPCSSVACKAVCSPVPLLECSEEPLYHLLEGEEEILPYPLIREPFDHEMLNFYSLLSQQIEGCDVCPESIGDHHLEVGAPLPGPYYQLLHGLSIPCEAGQGEDQSPTFRIKRYAPVPSFSRYLDEALITNQNLSFIGDPFKERVKEFRHTDAPVRDSLMRDVDSEELVYVEGCLPQREAHVDVEDQAKYDEGGRISALAKVNSPYLPKLNLEGFDLQLRELEDVGFGFMACSFCYGSLSDERVNPVGASLVPAFESIERGIGFYLLKSPPAEGTEEARMAFRSLWNCLESTYLASYFLHLALWIEAVVIDVLVRGRASWALDLLRDLFPMLDRLNLFSLILSFFEEFSPVLGLLFDGRGDGFRRMKSADGYQHAVSDDLLDGDADRLREFSCLVQKEKEDEDQLQHFSSPPFRWGSKWRGEYFPLPL